MDIKNDNSRDQQTKALGFLCLSGFFHIIP